MTNSKTPDQLANDAAEAIRGLNHTTLSANLGWKYPGDAYQVVGGLNQMARGLGQALDQIAQHIERLSESGHISHDHGGAGTKEVATALEGLEWARVDADALVSRLVTVHSALARLAWKD